MALTDDEPHIPLDDNAIALGLLDQSGTPARLAPYSILSALQYVY
jgi:hypothetical protein